MKKYFDDDYTLDIKLSCYFSEDEKRDTELLIKETRLYNHLNETINSLSFKLITHKKYNELQHYTFSITCSSKQREIYIDLILNLLIEDYEYLSSIYLIGTFELELLIKYDRCATLKIGREQLQKLNFISKGGCNISLNADYINYDVNNVEENNLNEDYIQLYFVSNKINDLSIKKIIEFWNVDFGKKYINTQNIEYHLLENLNQQIFIISIKEDVNNENYNKLYLDLCRFILNNNYFLLRNNIEVNIAFLHKFNDGGEVSVDDMLSLNANFIITKSRNNENPSLLETYNAFGISLLK